MATMAILATIGCTVVFLLGLWGLNSPPMEFSSHSARIWGFLTSGGALAILHRTGTIQTALDAGPIAKPMEMVMIALFTILTLFCFVLEIAVLLSLSHDD